LQLFLALSSSQAEAKREEAELQQARHTRKQSLWLMCHFYGRPSHSPSASRRRG